MKEIFRLDHGNYLVFIKLLKSISYDPSPCIVENSVMTKILGTSIIVSDLTNLIGEDKSFSIVGVKNLLSVSRSIGNNFKHFIVYDDGKYFYIFDFGRLVFRSYKNISYERITIPNEANIEANIGKLEVKNLGKNARFLYSNKTFYAISFSDDIIYYLDENFKGLLDPEVELVSSDFMSISPDNVEDILIISDDEDVLWLKTIYNIDGIILNQFEPLSTRRKNDII